MEGHGPSGGEPSRDRPAARNAASAARRARLLLVALVAVGLVARLGLALAMPEERAAWAPEAWAYLKLGRSLAAGDGLAMPADLLADESAAAGRDGGAESPGPAHAQPRLAARMPGYPLLVAACERLSERGVRLLAIVQSLFGAAAMGLAAYLAWRLAARRKGAAETLVGPACAWAAAAAAALLTFDPYQVYACAVVLPVVPLGFMLLAATGAGLEFLEVSRQGGRAWPWAALAGLALAAAAYLDWRMAGLAPVLGLAALVAPGRRRYLVGWAAGLAVMALVLAPWLVRNAVVLGSPVLTTDVGARLLEGADGAADPGLDPAGRSESAALSDPAGRTEPAAEAARPPSWRGSARGLSEAARDGACLRSALRRIGADPARWLGVVARRAAAIWSPWPAPEHRSLPLPPVAGYTSLLPTAVLALGGVWALRRRPAELAWLLALPLVATAAAAVLAGGVEDRLPVGPVLAVLGGVGLAAAVARPGEKAAPGAGR